MQDYEMLEFSALAAGVNIKSRSESNLWAECPGFGLRVWNPLEDDGDAFRLAVKLGLFNNVEFYLLKVVPNDAGHSSSAMRRAIVSVAAEKGKLMQCDHAAQALG
jgi:hypothetical protein